MSATSDSSRWSPVRAVIVIGTRCRFLARRSAVTMISSMISALLFATLSSPTFVDETICDIACVCGAPMDSNTISALNVLKTPLLILSFIARTQRGDKSIPLVPLKILMYCLQFCRWIDSEFGSQNMTTPFID